MRFLDDFRRGLERQKVVDGREGAWLDPRRWSWVTRLAIAGAIVFFASSILAAILIRNWVEDVVREWDRQNRTPIQRERGRGASPETEDGIPGAERTPS